MHRQRQVGDFVVGLNDDLIFILEILNRDNSTELGIANRSKEGQGIGISVIAQVNFDLTRRCIAGSLGQLVTETQ